MGVSGAIVYYVVDEEQKGRGQGGALNPERGYETAKYLMGESTHPASKDAQNETRTQPGVMRAAPNNTFASVSVSPRATKAGVLEFRSFSSTPFA